LRLWKARAECGTPGTTPYASSNNGAFIITNNASDPELAFKWADALDHIEATTRSIHKVKGSRLGLGQRR
jgi:hypothetical protein